MSRRSAAITLFEILPTLAPARVVALWHVLEHLTNPSEIMEAAADRLEPGGLLAVGVPNPHAFQFRLMRARWPSLDAPRHVVLIPAATLIERGESLGLNCVELITDDPFGRHSNLFGWSYALARRPATGLGRFNHYGAGLLRKLARPIEGRGLNGSAVLMLFRRDPQE